MCEYYDSHGHPGRKYVSCDGCMVVAGGNQHGAVGRSPCLIDQ